MTMSTVSVRELAPALRKRAEAEINEDPRRTPSDILAIKQWLAKQPHLESIKASDQWLVAFLRGCKFSLERTKEKLDMYYTLRTIAPDLFAERDPLSPRNQELLKLGVYLPLRECGSADGTRPCLLRLGVHDSSRFQLMELIKLSFMITEILMLEDDHFTVAGEELILDMKGVSLSLVGQFTPSLARKVTTSMERALPVRQRGNHMMHTPPGFEAGFALFKSFLSDKLKKRIRVHNQDYSALYKYISKKTLPAEYGGDDGNVQDLIDEWKRKVESYRDWFLQEENHKSEEARRPGKAKTSEELFGLDGSFRKLDLD